MTVSKTRFGLSLLTAGALSLMLTACGGGGGGSSDSATATPTGTVNMAITDGPSDNFSHVWVTIKAVSFHSTQDQTWSAGDATWQTTTLPQPVTVDLTALNNGTLNNLFQGLSLPVGTYRQIRLFLVGEDDALTTSAQSTLDSSGTALQYNDQVEYTNTKNNSGTLLEAPLEIATPVQGIQLVGTFVVAANSPLNLAVDFDLNEDIVPFRHDGMTAFTLRPNLRYFDLDDAGAIVGKVDTTSLCPAATMPTSSCAYNLVVKAERLTPDGSRHFDQRATTIRADGTFALFPLPVRDANGNAIIYDVLVRGRNMETLLVQAVPVTMGTTPGSSPTNVQSGSAIPVTVNANEYYAQFASPLQPLTSGWAIFQQTLPGTSSVPYEVRWQPTEPFTGLLFNNLLTTDGVALTPGPLHVASYNNGGALTFNSMTPVEGLGGYAVATNDGAYYTLSANTTVSPPASGTAQTFVPPVPTLDAGIVAGTLTGNIAVTNSAGYDHGQLVVVRYATIVTSDETDVDAALLNHGGTFTVAGLPAGSASTPVPGAYYYAYLRLWKAGMHRPAKIIPINGMIDLRKTSTASGFNVTIP